ncbi:mediator of RNA polymerase II transcription subunit 15-like [Diprion similis]|uniref:mediator of RNA polymerase II transcription subunit 15-like n=1 Tax=Diprion similis TaxID=362088 RepID=UPI001EF99042|nr:mediator of RNA polymerase II transcription subunit 15-like [Diprion similis]
MKVFVVISVFVALAVAEPPAYRGQNQQQRRYYFARQEEATPAQADADAPYPPSGWKPDGPSFDLPQRQLEDSYGPPNSSGGPVSTDQQQQYPAQDSRAQGNQQEQQQQQGFPVNSQRFQSRQQQQQQQQQQFATAQNQDQQRQYLAPVSQPRNIQYGPPEPQEQFQPPRPDQEYGAPWTTTEEPSTTTEIEDSTTTSAPQTDSDVEPVNSVNELDEEGDLDEQQVEAQQQDRQKGQYYVALPDGRLQRIQYVSHQDLEAMKYFARIQAENVEPLRGPIYSYSPLQELQIAPASLRYNPVSPAVASASAPAKIELQEEAAPSPPLAATLLRYSYGAPSPVVPLSQNSRYSASYKAPNPETRYLLSF